MKSPSVYEDINYVFSKNTLTQIGIFIPTQIFLFCFFYGKFYLNYYALDATVYFSTIDYVGAFIGNMFLPVSFLVVFLAVASSFIPVLAMIKRNRRYIEIRYSRLYKVMRNIILFFNKLTMTVLFLIISLVNLFIMVYLRDNYLLHIVSMYVNQLTIALFVLFYLQPYFPREFFLSVFVTCFVISMSYITAAQTYGLESKFPKYSVCYNAVKNHDVKLLANSSDFFLFYDQKLDRSFAVPVRSISSISSFDSSVPRATYYHELEVLKGDVAILKEQWEKLMTSIAPFHLEASKLVQLLTEAELLVAPEDPTLRFAQFKKLSLSLYRKQLNLRGLQLIKRHEDVLKTFEKLVQRRQKIEKRIEQLELTAQELNIYFDKKELPEFKFPEFKLPEFKLP